MSRGLPAILVRCVRLVNSAHNTALPADSEGLAPSDHVLSVGKARRSGGTWLIWPNQGERGGDPDLRSSQPDLLDCSR